MTEVLYEQLDFEQDPLFERIISDLMEQHYSLVPDYLGLAERAALREDLLRHYREDDFRKAAIGNQFNEQVRRSVRGDFIFWLDRKDSSGACQLFWEKTDRLVAYLNRTCFLGIRESEFHFAVYPEGSFYKRHLDTFQNDDRRTLSLVCYLNPEDWSPEDGGTLVLYPERDGREEKVPVCPAPGLMVLFDSQRLEHEVLPARRSRLSITGWFKTR